jgi:TPR repeat protein
MNSKSIRLLVTAMALVFAVPVAADDFADGKQAFEAFNHRKAIRLLLPLAQKGDPRAQHLLGHAYFRISRVGDGFKKAQHWLELAVAQDYTPAFTPLGQLLLKKNKGGSVRGLRLIQTAVARGNAEAQCALGWLKLLGQGVVPTDLQESRRLFLMSAEQKYKFAIFSLAHWSAHDQGKKPDYIEVWKWAIVDSRIGTKGAVYIFREKAMKHLTKEQIAEAKRRAAAWLKAHGETP